ncbi:hypothetical protein Tsubulata_024520 [Turnera subulata]|uniref:FAS1 domain-containing protein n=1 Tax=Turnera subulata TaxID=218843 RepID=A0A9Q0FD80_9ROSI|nr:hypothetical protein Tsubulata_024520 [Turnera subulata]
MKQQQTTLLSFSALVLLLFHCTLAQSPAPVAAPAKAPAAAAAPPPRKAPSPPPPSDAASPPVMVPPERTKGPPSVNKILDKAGHFTFFSRLIKTTQEDIQLFSQLNDSSDGVTVFAPTDGAFQTIIKSGTLNSLTDQEKIVLVQFHIIPRFLSTSQFQTVSNPIKTLAGSGKGFGLNVITSESLVNVSTGLTNTSVSGIVYTDSKLAIYQVDKVLLPLNLFAPKPPAPAPAAPKKAKDDGAESPVVPKDVSGAPIIVTYYNNLVAILGAVMFAAMFSL